MTVCSFRILLGKQLYRFEKVQKSIFIPLAKRHSLLKVINRFGQKITLAQYASRMNIRLLSPADFNSKLRDRGVDRKVTVQKVCRVCKDEKDVRSVLDEIWNRPSNAQEILDETLSRNQSVFDFEQVLTN